MKRILIIDDTADVLENLGELLRMEGYTIDDAPDGIDALRHLSNNHPTSYPDLIITDLRMPRMDGFEFLEKIKSSDDLKSIPVLIFSANAIPENEKKSKVLGAVGFLKKPCSTEHLLQTIQAALGTN